MSVWQSAFQVREEIANLWAGELGRSIEADTVSQLRSRYGGNYSATDIVSQRVRGIETATPWWISGDMVRLVEQAWPSMPDQPLMETDLFCTNGVVVFESPLEMTDHGERGPVPVSVVAWTPGFEDPILGPLVALTFYADSATISDLWQIPRLASLARWVPVQSTSWAYGKGFTVERGSNAGKTSYWRRMMAALWTLSAQPLASVQSFRAPRQMRRSGAIQPGAPDSVSVVTLRRLAGLRADPETSDVSWSHRWLVSGHWRNQWCPRAATHRHTWIAPYVKGPENRPLVVRERAYVWSR